MSTIGTLNVALTAETSQFTKSFETIQAKMKSFGAAAKDVAIKAGIAFTGASLGIKTMIDAANVQREAELKLASAIQGTGQAIDIEKIKQYAASLQQVTTFGDEATIESAALLATFQLTESQIINLLPRVQNLSSMYGMSLKSAAIQVGKAMAGNIEGFSRFGIVLTDTQKEVFKTGTELEKTSVLMRALDANTGNAAQALAQTGAGAMAQAANAAGDLREELGFMLEGAIVPLMQGSKEMFEGMIGFVKNLSPEIKDLASKFIIFGTLALGAVTTLGAVGALLPVLATGIAGIGTAMVAVAPPLLAVAAAAAAVVTAVGLVKKLKVGGISGVKEETQEKGVFGTLASSFSEGLDTVLEPLKSLGFDLSSNLNPDMKQFDKEIVKASKSLSEVKPLDFGEIKLPSDLVKSIQTSTQGFDFTDDAPSKEFTDNIQKSVDSAIGLSQVFDNAANVLIDNAIQGTERFNQVFSQAMTSLKLVGESASQSEKMQAVLIGGLTGLLMQTQAFATITRALDGVIGITVQFLDGFLSGLIPLIISVGQLTGVIVGFSTVVLSVLSPAIEAISVGLTFVIENIAEGFRKAVNGVLEIIADAIDKIPFLSGKSIRDMKIDKLTDIVSDTTDVMGDDFAGLMTEFEELPSGLNDFSESLDTATESISNAPQGFKIALERFKAIQTGPGFLTNSTISGTSGAFGGQTMAVNINNMNVSAENTEDFIQSVQDEAGWQAFTSAARNEAGITTGPMWMMGMGMYT